MIDTASREDVLASTKPPTVDDQKLAALDDFVARRTAEGGAPPES